MSIVTLTTCYSPIEANFLKDQLENEGIECFLTNQNFTNLMPGFNGMLGSGIQVMIEEKDFTLAQFFLTKPNTEQAITCPFCQSINTEYGMGKNKLKKTFFAFLSFLFVVPLGNIRNTYFCKDCNQDFNISDKMKKQNKMKKIINICV
jgi:hypothetical protein